MSKSESSWSRVSLTSFGQELVEQNLRLAYAFAARIPRPLGLSQDEYESECLAALCRSAGYFNASLGFQFSTFAWFGMKMWRREIIRKLVRDERVAFKDPESLMFKMLRDASRTNTVDEDEAWELLMQRALSVHDGSLLVQRARDGVGIRTIATQMGVSKERVRQRMIAASSRVRAKF